MIILSGCGSPQTGETKPDNPVIIEMAKVKIRLDAFHFYINLNYPENLDQTDNELLSYIFDKFKRDLLIAEVSQGLGFRIADEQVEDFIKFKMTGRNFLALSEEEQATWRRGIRRRLAIRQFLEREIIDDVSISDDAINLYYQEHEQSFKEEALYQLRFLQTLNEERASAFLKEIKKTKQLFKEIAGQYAENEGYQIVTPMRLNELPEPFRKAVVRMKPGQHSSAIPIKHGETTYYYVLYLESITPEFQIPYEEAYHQIRKKLEIERRQALLEERVQQFGTMIRTKVYFERLPFRYLPPAQRKEV